MKRGGILAIFLALCLLLGACSSGSAPESSYSGNENAMTMTEPSSEAAKAESSTAEPSASEAYDDAPMESAEEEYSTEGAPQPPTGGSNAMASSSMQRSGDTAYALPESESYLEIDENTVKSTDSDPMLTFSLKVDTASYSNVQRYLESGNLPPADAVRVEELINYFPYEGKMKTEDGHPFAIYTEVGPSPFDENKYMAYIRVKSEDIDKSELPQSNLTFLIDTSGSMNSYDKLPLLKSAFSLLVETLDEDDVVSIVTYAGSAGVVLDSVSGADKERILSAIENLTAGGSTAGAEGILTAYALAEKNFVQGGNNRVILATDGDFNVGPASNQELEDLIGEKRDGGVYLSILGFGTGNIRDDLMETLSKHGNGNYAYINNLTTAKKVLVDEISSNLFTIADDVKAQVEFNPANVSSYRLIGYENRSLKNEDFNDDTKDAGEIGVGTDVVVMFELELAGQSGSTGTKYSSSSSSSAQESASGEFADELFEVRINYKNPGESTSENIVHPVKTSRLKEKNTSDFGFACSVAAFGQMLRGSVYTENVTIDQVMQLAKENLGRDENGYRLDYLLLLQQYKQLIS